MSDTDLMNLTVPELKKKLASYGLSRSGRKNDMVTRLEQAGMLQDKNKAEKRVNLTAGEERPEGESLKKKPDEFGLCKAEGLFLDGKFHDNCRGCSIDPAKVITQPTRTASLDNLPTIHQKQASGYEGKLFEKCRNCTFWLTHQSILEKTCEFCQTPFK